MEFRSLNKMRRTAIITAAGIRPVRRILAAAFLILFFSAGTLISDTPRVKLMGSRQPGGILIGHAPGARRVLYSGERIPVSDGFFTIGFDRDDIGERRLLIRFRDGRTYEEDINLARRDYREQHVSGLQSRHVTLSGDDIERVSREREIFRRALDEAMKVDRAYYKSGFMRPVEGGRLTGVFGSVRILNGVPGNPHNGIDIALPEGAPVYAMSDAVVQLTGDFFYNGKFVMLSHGHGLISMYLHLSKIDVEIGEKVSIGDKIGEVGSTGRSTGPHLHWGVQWGRRRIDPALLVSGAPFMPVGRRIIVSVEQQKLYLYEDEKLLKEYPISTAARGVGNRAGSYMTPPGLHRVAVKIGDGAPKGRVFVGRVDTGRDAEIFKEPVNVPGDAILTRILRLEGLEPGVNRGPGIDSFSRYIYIHGTQEEGFIGTPASKGCVRMKNRDVIELFDLVEEGTPVFINP